MMVGSLAFAWLVAAGNVATAFEAAVPDCGASVPTCVGIELFVVVRDGEPVQTPHWFSAEVEHANQLFAAIGVGFELAAVHPVSARWGHIETRLHRDQLGREHDRISGLAHVFMVDVLEDVDVADNTLYGVHWRDRADVSHRWVILSGKDSSASALAHEMGHYFGLPHSGYKISIMNKRPRETPTWPERVFAPPEVRRMKQELAAMLKSGFLVARRSRRPETSGPSSLRRQ